jgi:hypothetical protein
VRHAQFGTLDQSFGPNYQAGCPAASQLTGMKRKTTDIVGAGEIS